MTQFVDLTLGGLSTGAIYAAIALSLVLIWRATGILNFAQGAMAMLTTFVALAVIQQTGSYWLALVVALLSGLLLGAVVERVLVRQVENAPPLNAVIVTLGLFILVEAVAGLIWGGAFRAFPTAVSDSGLRLGGRQVPLSPNDLFIIGAVFLVMLALLVLFRLTDLGLQMRAAAASQEVARLLGVRVGRMLTLGWALATLAGSLAGILVAHRTFLHPANMDVVFVFGFTAAILGGLDSPLGAVVGGIAVGLSLSYVGGYLGSDLTALAALVILVAVLMVRPDGLFGRTSVRRV